DSRGLLWHLIRVDGIRERRLAAEFESWDIVDRETVPVAMLAGEAEHRERLRAKLLGFVGLEPRHDPAAWGEFRRELGEEVAGPRARGHHHVVGLVATLVGFHSD